MEVGNCLAQMKNDVTIVGMESGMSSRCYGHAKS
jgi:hypothetical protein